MSKDIEIDYAFLVGLLAGVVRGEPFAQRLFDQIEFRESILAREANLASDLGSAKSGDESAPDLDHLSHWIGKRGSQGGRDAIARIRDFLRGAERVTWCDPYLLGGRLSETFDDSEDYAGTVAGVLPSSVKQLRIFVPNRPRVPAPGADPGQATLVWRRLKEGRQFEMVETHEIHDRYILRDGKAGILVGSSFGGLGGRFCTILPLPGEDVAELYGILDEIVAAQR